MEPSLHHGKHYINNTILLNFYKLKRSSNNLFDMPIII